MNKKQNKKCSVCGRIIFSNRWSRCFGRCRKIVCLNCSVDNKCIDCYTIINQKSIVEEYYRYISEMRGISETQKISRKFSRELPSIQNE